LSVRSGLPVLAEKVTSFWVIQAMRPVVSCASTWMTAIMACPSALIMTWRQ